MNREQNPDGVDRHFRPRELVDQGEHGEGAIVSLSVEELDAQLRFYLLGKGFNFRERPGSVGHSHCGRSHQV